MVLYITVNTKEKKNIRLKKGEKISIKSLSEKLSISRPTARNVIINQLHEGNLELYQEGKETWYQVVC